MAAAASDAAASKRPAVRGSAAAGNATTAGMGESASRGSDSVSGQHPPDAANDAMDDEDRFAQQPELITAQDEEDDPAPNVF